jgi:molybdopterin-guanine dinucleotide biosynthesis protein A
MNQEHAGIILCGGRSSRMGLAKLMLPFGPETMLQRVARLLGQACDPLVVVAAPGQELPPLAPGVIVARDRRPGQGPLEGLSAGLHALPGEVESAFACGCDVPLLVPAFVRRMFELLGDESCAVPVCGGFQHPLAAVYRRSLVERVDEFLAGGRLAPSQLFDSVPTRRVSEAELRSVDPELDTLKNLNRPEDYLAALARAGFTAPAEVAAALAQPRDLD